MMDFILKLKNTKKVEFVLTKFMIKKMMGGMIVGK
jgi:hypothetical protein